MIIQGMLLTDKGPIDIKDLKLGDKVLNQMHRALTVSNISKKKVSCGYTFSKNTALIVSVGTVIKTAYGDKVIEALEGKAIYIAQPNMRLVKDKAVKVVKEEMEGYEIEIEGSNSVFCSNYGLGLEV